MKVSTESIWWAIVFVGIFIGLCLSLCFLIDTPAHKTNAQFHYIKDQFGNCFAIVESDVNGFVVRGIVAVPKC